MGRKKSNQTNKQTLETKGTNALTIDHIKQIAQLPGFMIMVANDWSSL